MSDVIRVLVSGVCGRMGQETAKAVCASPDLALVGACDLVNAGAPLSSVIPGLPANVVIGESLAMAIAACEPDVLVDFTSPGSVMANLRTSLERGVATVVGTTGVTQENLVEIREISARCGAPVLVAPNFAIGAVLMMKFAAEAARYLPSVEIIELHHDKKLDAPSGTSIKTAEMIAANRDKASSAGAQTPPRGETHFGVQVHSVRLPGLVAHQEVIFGGPGQTLTIRHDSLDRTSFMPGVLMAVRKVRDLSGVVYGLENIL